MPALSIKRFSGPGTTLIWQALVQCLLVAPQGAKIRHCPVQPDQSQQTFQEPGNLPKWHANITELLLPTSLSTWRRRSNYLWIKPDRQRSAPLQAIIVRRPIRGLVLRRGPTAHDLQLSCWFHTVNSSIRFVQQSLSDGQVN